jgi:hypothetical protein
MPPPPPPPSNQCSQSVHDGGCIGSPSRLGGAWQLVVGGRSSGVDIARELHGTASWVYVMEKGCPGPDPLVAPAEACAHVPLGTRLHADGQLRIGGGGGGDRRCSGAPLRPFWRPL